MQRYKFDSDSLYSLKNELYKEIPGLYPELVTECYTEDNLIKVINKIQEIIDNPIITEEEMPKVNKEEITCFDEETNKKLNEIFSNNDLAFFGHGGAGETIINTEFKCKYPNLLSHFIPLSQTNESLSQFKAWPHKNCPQIAVMALNMHEYNPIYKPFKGEGSSGETLYSIANDYFVGYYDNDKGEFILNPNFKMRHEFDEECTVYQKEISVHAVSGPDEIVKFDKELGNIISILNSASNVTYLDEQGYKEVKEQILHKIKNLKELQDVITPEYIDKLEKKTETVDNQTNNTFDWNGDWGFPAPGSISPPSNNDIFGADLVFPSPDKPKTK